MDTEGENNSGLSKDILKSLRRLYENEHFKKLIIESVLASNDESSLLIQGVTLMSSNLSKGDKLVNLLATLCINFKGLTMKEIQNVTELSQTEIEILMLPFRSYIINHKDYIKLINSTFSKLFLSNFYSDRQVRQDLHKKIATELSKTVPSIRSLEEQTNNFYMAQDFFQLKQTLSSIENFVLLFNETAKYDLFKFWKRLEEKGFDPIQEYNKSFELFEMHFNPKDSEIFMINIQLCRFFKELSEFESQFTPEFRHPLIQGKVEQLVESLDYQFKGKQKEKKLESAEEKECSFYKADPLLKHMRINRSKLLELYFPLQELFDSKNEIVDKVEGFIKSEYETNAKQRNHLESIGILQELKEIRMLDQMKTAIMKPHEMLNVDIPLNRQKFVDHFLTILDEKYSFKKKYTNKRVDEVCFIVRDNKYDENDSSDIMRMGNVESEVDAATKLILEIDLSIEKPQPRLYYYYKRWLWMNFPWICLSKERLDFSTLIAFCFSDDRSSLDNSQEAILYFKCLSIIKMSKEKKSLVLKENNTMTSGISKKKNLEKRFTKSNILYKSNKVSIQDPESTGDLLPAYKEVIVNDGLTRKQRQIAEEMSKTNCKDLNKAINAEKLREVLSRSLFLEKSILKNNLMSMNQLVFNGNVAEPSKLYASKMNNVNQLMHKWNPKEIYLLQRKDKSVTSEFNSVVFQKTNSISKVVKLDEINDNKKNIQLSLLTSQNEETAMIVSSTEKKVTEIQRRWTVEVDRKNRYQLIIEVCLINQTTTEKWIRNLNHYLAPTRKTKKDLEQHVIKKQKDLEAKRVKCRKLYDNLIKNKEKHEGFQVSFDNFIQEKECIDRKVLEFDRNVLNNVSKNLALENGQMNMETSKMQQSTFKLNMIQREQELEKRFEELQERLMAVWPLVCLEDQEDLGVNKENLLENLDPNWKNSRKLRNFQMNLQTLKKLEVILQEGQINARASSIRAQ